MGGSTVEPAVWEEVVRICEVIGVVVDGIDAASRKDVISMGRY